MDRHPLKRGKNASHLLVEPPAAWVYDFCMGCYDFPINISKTGDNLLAFLSCRASTRSRISAAAAAQSLGLGFVEIPWDSFYGNDHVHWRAKENFKTETWSMRSLGVVAIVARPTHQEWLELFADESPIPVVNACSEMWHPLQAIADLRALFEVFQGFEGVKVAIVGNGTHPTVSSFCTIGARMGVHITVVAPNEYAPPLRILASDGPGRVEHLISLEAALSRCDAVYTDEWFYRRPTDAEHSLFAKYRLSKETLMNIKPTPYVLHCLPHADEIETSILFGDRSLVWRQAALRRTCLVAVLRTLLQQSLECDEGWR